MTAFHLRQLAERIQHANLVPLKLQWHAPRETERQCLDEEAETQSAGCRTSFTKTASRHTQQQMN